MTQVVIKKEKPCVLTEEFFEAGMYVVDSENNVFITSFNTDREELFVVCLDDGSMFKFNNPDNKLYDRVVYTILEKGTVLEITV